MQVRATQVINDEVRDLGTHAFSLFHGRCNALMRQLNSSGGKEESERREVEMVASASNSLPKSLQGQFSKVRARETSQDIFTHYFATFLGKKKYFCQLERPDRNYVF